MTALAISGMSVVLLASAMDPERRYYGDEDSVATVYASAETDPVASSDDAADDPAIWVHPSNPARSFILGTDKQAGLGVYALNGERLQFLPTGRLNNVDLRRNLTVQEWRGDLAAASNRSINGVSVFAINEKGVSELGQFSVNLNEPYGACMGEWEGQPLVFVSYKTGQLQTYRIDQLNVTSESGDSVAVSLLAQHNFASQLEGCVFDEFTQGLYVGEEEHGLWYMELSEDREGFQWSSLKLLESVNGQNGVAADIEGIALYTRTDGSGYVLISSQGNDSYGVYDRQSHEFLGRFRIIAGEDIDGSQETDGLEVTAMPLGSRYPKGVLVVQDGFNMPAGSAQNFKIVDWRDVATGLEL